MDISDEKDVDMVRAAIEKLVSQAQKGANPSSQPRTIGTFNRKPAIFSDMNHKDEEKDTYKRSNSLKDTYTTKFMMEFTNNLDKLIRADLKEGNSVSELVLQIYNQTVAGNVQSKKYEPFQPGRLSVARSTAVPPALKDTEV